MATNRPLKTRTKLGYYQMTKRGSSKGLNIGKALDGEKFPSDIGDNFNVYLVEEQGEAYVKVVPSREG